MWAPYYNLRTFVITRPPLVVFTLCLSVFAITTLSLAYVMRIGPVRNPEISLDWNEIMDHMSKWMLCIGTESPNHKKPFLTYHLERFNWKEVESSALKATNNTVSISLHLKLSNTIKNLPNDVNVLWGNVSLADLGFDDSLANQTVLTVIDFGETRKIDNCTKDGYCDVIPSACVTFQSQSPPFPNVKESKTCRWRKRKPATVFMILNSVSSENAATCPGTVVLQQYIPDPSLVETLSYNEQTLMTLHLTYTSYFLFVMVITVLCYAVVRGQVKSVISNEKA